MLDLTPKEISERKGLVINPAKTCQPIGAMYAALGIRGCMPHSHGSQGCCSYHRMHLTRHFRDPVIGSTSSFTEGAAVFGGKSNLTEAIKNVFTIYNPEVIAINTTCLSETIGDDIPSIVLSMDIPEDKFVFHANTPSYVGSHITGFSNMVKAMVKNFTKPKESDNGKINIIPGFVNPGDMREIKRILKSMDTPFIMFPDTSGVLDTAMTGKYEMFPIGGVTIEELKDTGNSIGTIAMGSWSSEAAANDLEKKSKSKTNIIKTPIGVKATDEFLMAISELTGKEISKELEEERGQLVDILTDTHFHFHGKKVAIYGDPDIVIALTEFCLSIGMIPIHVLTGTPGEAFETTIKDMLKTAGIEGNVKAWGDLFTLHQWIKNEPVDLMIGNTYGKFIAKAEDIPLVRVGFPILDRAVHSYMPMVGYKGTMRLIEMIGNSLLDRVDRDAKDEDLELTM
ncbi:MAG: nitrogenase molybdenum-iron protein subunit beta [Fusobacteriaceae bacterium]|nr:nitrogenase molybdenum-iron protein subunit beta [Fusobacteriaceae bacterium]